MAGSKFRRQHPIGGYIVDFVCVERMLVIEVDGGQHSDEAAYDTKRDLRLESLGFNVMRFWNTEVLLETEAVLEVILDFLLEPPHLDPPPGGGRK